jgi:hypothetical protein
LRAGEARAARVAALVLAAVAAVGSATTLADRSAAPSSARPFEAANDAWERGDYVAALNGYLQLLASPGGDRWLRPIALTTGELFETRELTSDGRAPRFSPDGSLIAYESGLETSRRTTIVRNDASRSEVADLPGVSATFSSTLAQVAYLKIPDHDEIRRASDALAAASLTARNRTQLTQTLAWLIARHAAIVVRDLASGREMELPAPELLKTGLTFSADGRVLYFLGAWESEPDRTDVYEISELSPKPVIVANAGGLKSAPIVDPAGHALIYTIPAQSPLRRPQESGGSGGSTARASDQSGEAVAAGASSGGATVVRRQPSFAIVDLASHRVSIVVGTAPALSGDGKTLAYIARDGNDYELMIGPTLGLQTAVKRTALRLDAPALSADGGRVAYQQMPQDDWEIFVANRDGSGEQRVTHEIQHDILPRFIGNDRLLALVGEPRHRRSYIYDLPDAHPVATRSPSDGHPDATGSASDARREAIASDARREAIGSTSDRRRVVQILPGSRIRLFHNNTIRTIAPEYQWSPSPDGQQILIGAERDGNTVSPERGVYLVDLRRTVTKTALVARLRANLKSETALRAAGTHAFAPIAADVRQVLSHVSTSRVFDYEKALFDFDSKHVSKPGNRRAAAYLFDTYTSFGYRPEYQWFDPASRSGVNASQPTEAPRPTTENRTANVVATLRGTVDPEIVYVVSSHYDSVEGGPGADDDTSGTAALLEAARVLAAHPLPATVVFASFTGEESGLLGSREFVRRAVAAHTHVAGALNNDMIGWTNDQRLDNTIRYSNPGIRDIQHAAAMLFTRLITYDARYFKGTDAASLYDAYGDVIGGIGSYPVLGSPHYHQPSDRLEFENHQLIAETSKTTIATAMMLASSPSRLTHLTIERGATQTSIAWAPSPEKGIVSYVVASGPAADPLRHRLTVTQPHAAVPALAAGTVVSVKAVNARGLEGWDWATIVVGDGAAQRATTP